MSIYTTFLACQHAMTPYLRKIIQIKQHFPDCCSVTIKINVNAILTGT